MRDDACVIARPRSGRADLGEVASAEPPRNDTKWGRFVSGFKRIVGMPDYPGYLQHMAERHPECAVLSEREFFNVQLNARYGNGASRCC